MKTYVTYGIVITFASAVLTLLLQILGLWTPEHLGTALIIGLLGGLAISVTGVILGTKAIRSTVGSEAFSYGQAFKVGFFIIFFTACAGLVFNFIYFKYLNPNFGEITAQWTQSLMERMGAPDAQIEQKVAEIRAKSTIARQLFNGCLGTLIMGTIISLITSAFLKRPAVESPLTAA